MKTALRTHNHKDNTITAEAGSVTMNQMSNQHVVRVVRKHLRWKTTILRKEINKMRVVLGKMNHLYIQTKLNDLDNSFSKTRSFTGMNGALYVYVD